MCLHFLSCHLILSNYSNISVIFSVYINIYIHMSKRLKFCHFMTCYDDREKWHAKILFNHFLKWNQNNRQHNKHYKNDEQFTMKEVESKAMFNSHWRIWEWKVIENGVLTVSEKWRIISKYIVEYIELTAYTCWHNFATHFNRSG